MSIAPVNFYSCLALVPVFGWEPVEPTSDPTPEPPPAPVNRESGGLLDAEPAPTPDSDSDRPALPKMQLVFKGFEWVFAPGIATFPRPDWMDGVTAGCTEEAEDDRRPRFDEAKLARQAVPHPPPPHAASSAEAGPAATDPSETE